MGHVEQQTFKPPEIFSVQGGSHNNSQVYTARKKSERPDGSQVMYFCATGYVSVTEQELDCDGGKNKALY